MTGKNYNGKIVSFVIVIMCLIGMRFTTGQTLGELMEDNLDDSVVFAIESVVILIATTLFSFVVFWLISILIMNKSLKHSTPEIRQIKVARMNSIVRWMSLITGIILTGLIYYRG